MLLLVLLQWSRRLCKYHFHECSENSHRCCTRWRSYFWKRKEKKQRRDINNVSANTSDRNARKLSWSMGFAFSWAWLLPSLPSSYKHHFFIPRSVLLWICVIILHFSSCETRVLLRWGSCVCDPFLRKFRFGDTLTDSLAVWAECCCQVFLKPWVFLLLCYKRA
jgi:hypothetical protein